MGKGKVKPEQQRRELYTYVMLLSLILMVFSIYEYEHLILYNQEWISEKVRLKLETFLSVEPLYFFLIAYCVFMAYFSDELSKEKKYFKDKISKKSKTKRWLIIARYLISFALVIVITQIEYYQPFFILLGGLLVVLYMDYGNFIYSLDNNVKFLSPLWKFIISYKKEDEKEDGYKPLKERAVQLNKTGIQYEGGEIVFRHRIQNGKKVVDLVNINPKRANIVRGIAGSGKTVSCLNPMGIQTINRDIPTFTYDFKFPDMTKVMLEAYRRKGANQKIKFGVSILDSKFIHNSWGISPINRKTLASELEADIYMTTFFTMMKKKWIIEPDFWAESIFAYTSAVSLAFKKYYPGEFSLANINHLLAKPYVEQIHWFKALGDDELMAKVENVARPVLDDKGGDQLSGIFSTMNNFLSKMANPYVYFNLSTNDISMDLNDPMNPSHLCVGNSNFFKKVFSPIISLYFTLTFTICNNSGKLPFHFLCDEAATTFLNGIEDFINTGRDRGMIATIGVQTDKQIDYAYGRELSNLLKSVFGNQYSGQVRDEETQRLISHALGKYIEKIKRVSEDKNGEKSYSYDEKEFNYIRPDEIGRLDPGYLVGSLAEGENKRFMGRFDISEYQDLYDKSKSLILPLSPTTLKLAQQDRISMDLINKYYKGNTRASNKINKIVLSYAFDKYNKIRKDTDNFINMYS